MARNGKNTGGKFAALFFTVFTIIQEKFIKCNILCFTSARLLPTKVYCAIFLHSGTTAVLVVRKLNNEYLSMICHVVACEIVF